MINLYTNNNHFNDTDIYIYSGNPTKSFYFISILVLYFIKKHHFKEPTQFISQLTSDLFVTIGNNPILIFDDVSYSGSQLSELLNSIYYNTVILNKNPAPNIFVSLIALNEFSKRKLEKVPIKRKTIHNDTIDLQFTNSPFKLLFLSERLYTPLILKLGIQRYAYLNIFFSLYTSDKPYVSIYLDHKIADEASTYKSALTYGPIVPNNYNYTKYFRHVDYTYNLWSGDNILKDEEDKLINDYNNINPDKPTTFKDYQMVYLIQDLITNLAQNEMDLDKTIVDNKFIPFIRSCNESIKLNNLITSPELLNVDYLLFMMPKGCLDNTDDCVVRSDNGVQYFIEDYRENNVGISELSELSDKINEITCPHSWYKKGELQMVCLSEEPILDTSASATTQLSGGKKTLKRKKHPKRRTNRRKYKKIECYVMVLVCL